ncbi:hypothetical protein BLSTO_02171 [Blastocystis sp. subtype 1]
MDEDRIPFSQCNDYLYRLQREELTQLFDYMRISQSGRMSKGEMISRIKEEYPFGFTLDQLAIIDIMFTIQRIQKFKWSAYGLKAPTNKNGTSLNPRVISNQLTKELEPLIYTHVYSTIHEGLLWIRILLVQPMDGRYEYVPSDTNDTKTVFIVHLLGSNYLFASQMPAAFTKLILTTVSIAFKQSRCEALHLTGNDVGNYLNQLKEKRPLERGFITETTPLLLRELPPNVHFLDEATIAANHAKSEYDWGIMDPPALQQVIVMVGVWEMSDVKSTANWKEGAVEVPDVKMSVELQGPNVMKGLKEMEEYGYAPAIPGLNVQLLNIPKNPQNEIVIQCLSDEEVEEDVE